MPQPIIIYLHGFGSNSRYDKVAFLRDAFPQLTIAAPDIPADPDAAFQIIDAFIIQHRARGARVILAGTSLGGFWTHIFGCRHSLDAVIMNPSLRPSFTLHRYTDGREGGRVPGFTGAMADGYATYEPLLDFSLTALRTVLLEQDDELLDSNASFAAYNPTCTTVMIPGGEHRFRSLDVLKNTIEGIVARMRSCG